MCTHQSKHQALPRLDPAERARLLAKAREHSRLLHEDPCEQALLDEIEALQADNPQPHR